MQTGSLLMQWPLGWLSDRYERRVVILTASLVVAASSLAIALVGGIWPLALYPLAALWGGCALSIYAICLAHAGDFAEPHQMVPLASSLLLSWAAGADRKSVVSGKSVSVRVDLGGRRIIKK